MNMEKQMIKNKEKLEKYVTEGYISGFGAGFDSDGNGDFLYIQTTCEEKNDKFDSSFCVFEVYSPTNKDVESAKLLLKQLSQKYQIPVDWNHL